MERSLGKRH